MAGFDPVGSAPVASVGGGTVPPGYYYPGSGSLTFVGYTPTTTGITPTSVSVVFREALYASNSTTRLATITRETLYAGSNLPTRESSIVRELMISTASPLPRVVSVHSISREVMKSFHSTSVSSISREVMRDATAIARIGNVSREVLLAISSSLKESQIVREALYAINPTATISSIVREVMRSGVVVSTDDGSISIIW